MEDIINTDDMKFDFAQWDDSKKIRVLLRLCWLLTLTAREL
jgi:hypothetical protein